MDRRADPPSGVWLCGRDQESPCISIINIKSHSCIGTVGTYTFNLLGREQAEKLLQMTPRHHHLKGAQHGAGNVTENREERRSFGKMEISKDVSFFKF